MKRKFVELMQVMALFKKLPKKKKKPEILIRKASKLS